MQVALLTREYPPEVYGGAGVHVEYLARELGKYVDLKVHCFGAKRDAKEVENSYGWWDALSGDAPHQAALRTLAVNLQMAGDLAQADLVHTHTWYANFGGHLAKLLYGIPHVMTSHSLEPLRPWKEEQLGGGYRVSSYVERTAAETCDRIIAVSAGMKEDILKAYPQVAPERVEVIYNGIDTEEYCERPGTETLLRYGVDPKKPVAMFVGRITRQKGVVHLLEAAEYFDPSVQLLLCAGAPDTKELLSEVTELVEALKKKRDGVIWVQDMLPRPTVIELLSASTVFVCPSIYEPFGIVNVEAMGTGTAVVASSVGGIREVVQNGETGFLVPYDGDVQGNPLNREQFARDFAARVNEVATNMEYAAQLGRAGRSRAVEKFSWKQVAKQTADLYQSLLGA